MGVCFGKYAKREKEKAPFCKSATPLQICNRNTFALLLYGFFDLYYTKFGGKSQSKPGEKGKTVLRNLPCSGLQRLPVLRVPQPVS